MDFRILGSLEVVEGEDVVLLGGPKQRVVLAHLILRSNRVVSADLLIDEVWGDDQPPAAKSSLHSYVSHLRSALGHDRLEGRSGGYVLHVADGEIDASRFEDLVGLARKQTAANDPATAVSLYAEADALWRGRALDDLAGQHSLEPGTARLEELRLTATEERISAELELARHAELVPTLETLVRAHPLRERLRCHLMLALYRAGRQADALAAYRRARNILADDLGIDPSPELRRLHERILRQDPALDAAGEPLRGYRLLEEIGAGSFGSVHRAFQPQVGREVAVKVIHPRYANDAEFIRRFEAEAQIVARLEHPHIVPLHDFWREPDGAYLVMRYLRGRSLRERLGRSPLTPEKAVHVVDQVALALAAAHRQGVVHRDVKPANILFDEDDNAYLSDFGIAKDTATADVTRRPEGSSSPLAYYLAPEEIRGEPVSGRTDVYGLGLVLFEALAGRHPFADSSSDEVIDRHLREPLPLLQPLRPELPPGIEKIIAVATAKDPAARYPDVTEFAGAVRAVLAPAVERPVPISTTDARNPYKGLRPFVEADALDFFGRDALVAEVVARLSKPESRFLAVVGPSGSGKSSVVGAGVVPALKAGALPGSESWFVLDMHPGTDPFAELETALTRVATEPVPRLADRLTREGAAVALLAEEILPAGTELLLVIDQFEELFTLVDDEANRARFLACLHNAVTDPRSRVRVVVTLRADFYDRPLSSRGLAELVKAHTVTVTPLTPEELQRAVSGPAEHAGLAVEPRLVAEIVADVADQAALPLLQYALTELFDHRVGSTLTLDAYLEIGGVPGALAGRAEDLYADLTEAGKEAARQLFLRLVTLGEEGSEDTRRRVLWAELTSLDVAAEAMVTAIDTFGARRLLSFDRDPATRGPTVEVAHEALLGEWARLRGWIEAAREYVRAHRRLASAAREWSAADGDPSFLLRGAQLTRFETWLSTSGLALTVSERSYLDASLSQRSDERAEEEARQARETALERRSRRRLRALVAVFAVAALVASALTVFAFNEQGRAERTTREATARELASAAELALEADSELAILLALEAADTARSAGESVLPEVIGALQRAVQTSRLTMRIPSGGEIADISADGALLALDSLGHPTDIQIWDAATGKYLRTLVSDSPVQGFAFSPDDRLLATASESSTITLWDPTTGSEVSRLGGHDPGIGPIAWSPDGREVAAVSGGTAGSDDHVVAWDVESGAELFAVGMDVIGHIAFLDPETLLVTHDFAESVAFLDAADGSTVDVLDTPGFMPWELHVVNERELVLGSDGEVQAWDLETRSMEWTVFVPTGYVQVSPEAGAVAVHGNEGRVTLYDLDDGSEWMTLAGHSAAVYAATFDPNGERLFTVGFDGETRVWDVTSTGPSALGAIDVGGWAFETVFSPDGGRVAVMADGRVSQFDLSTGERLMSFGHDVSWFEPAPVSADWRYVAFVDADGEARVRDFGTNSPVAELPACTLPKGFSPDGSALVLDGVSLCESDAAPRGTELRSRVIDPITGAELLDLGERELFGLRAPFNPGEALEPGRYLALNADSERAEVHDMTTGERIVSLEWDDDIPLSLNYDPTGRYLAIGTQNGRALVLDLLAVVNGSTIDEALILDVTAGGGGVGVSLSHDGVLATFAFDSHLRLWDIQTGDLLVELRTGSPEVPVASFSPDGTYLLYRDGDVLRKWLLETDELIELAENRVGRGFTEDECRRYPNVKQCQSA